MLADTVLADTMLTDPPIHPPVGYHTWWWVVVALCLAGIIAIGWWATRALRAARPTALPGDPLEALREETLARIEETEATFAAGRLSAAAAHRRLSADVRRFAGVATGGDADYQVLPQLRAAAVKDPRLEPVAELVAEVAAAAFAPDAQGDLPSAAGRAREVITSWS